MPDNAPPIRGDVPPRMHPGMLEPLQAALDAGGDYGRWALDSGREALTMMYNVYAAAEEAEKALDRARPKNGRGAAADVVMGEDGRVVALHGRENEFAEQMERAYRQTIPHVERRLADLGRYCTAVTEQLADTLKYKAAVAGPGLAQATEIRAHIKSLPATERMELLMSAVTNGDQQTVHAVLFAPLYLSGLDQKQAETIRQHAYEKWAPETHALARAISTIIERVTDARGDLTKRYEKAKRYASPPKRDAELKLGELAEVARGF